VSNQYRMHPDGSGMEQLTHYGTADLRATQPRSPPAVAGIVFTAVMPSRRCLWAIPAAGGEPLGLAQGGVYMQGAWQPRVPIAASPLPGTPSHVRIMPIAAD
jgi:hypothetical protein